MTTPQAETYELDISERLRYLMREHKLTVAQLAQKAGVSKSAMEKYLAGSGAPKAASIAQICDELGVNAHWLIFGRPDEDLRIIRNAVSSVVINLLSEMKSGEGETSPFFALKYGTQEWRMFALTLADERALEAVDFVIKARAKAERQAVEGVRVVDGPIMPFEHQVADEN